MRSVEHHTNSGRYEKSCVESELCLCQGVGVEIMRPWYDFRQFRWRSRNQITWQLLCFSKPLADDFESALREQFIHGKCNSWRNHRLCYLGYFAL